METGGVATAWVGGCRPAVGVAMLAAVTHKVALPEYAIRYHSTYGTLGAEVRVAHEFCVWHLVKRTVVKSEAVL